MPEICAYEPIIRVVDVVRDYPLGVDRVIEAPVRGVPFAVRLSRSAVLWHLHHRPRMIERVEGKPPLEARADLMEALTAAVVADRRPNPLPGVTIEYGGLYADQQRSFHQLAIVLVAGTVAMFLVLLWEFARVAPAVAILLGALSCLAGSFIALDLTGISLNISSFMGVIMVIGITAKNGILLLDHAEHDVGGGASPRDALIEAAKLRLRPILMTTLATAAGLFPLALGLGAGAKIQQPLALAVIGGLAFAMLLSTALTGGLYLLGTRKLPGSGESLNANAPVERAN
jgi:multidrug efflux pump subunit AcrB